MVRLIVKFEASMDELVEELNRAMPCAVSAGHENVVKSLIRFGANKIDSL